MSAEEAREGHQEPSPLQRSQQAPRCLTARAQSLDSTGHVSRLQVTSLFWAKETRDIRHQLQTEAPNPSPGRSSQPPSPPARLPLGRKAVMAAGLCALWSRSPHPGTHAFSDQGQARGHGKALPYQPASPGHRHRAGRGVLRPTLRAPLSRPHRNHNICVNQTLPIGLPGPGLHRENKNICTGRPTTLHSRAH